MYWNSTGKETLHGMYNSLQSLATSDDQTNATLAYNGSTGRWAQT